jgi:hypothetical protein
MISNFMQIIDKYRSRLKTTEYPSGFNHQDANKFTSDYEYTKTLPNYHFDLDVKEKEGDYFDVIGKFEGDWDQELDQAIRDSFPARCRDRGWPVLGGPVPTLQLEMNDEEGWGYSPLHAQSNAIKNKYMAEHCPNLIKIANYFEIEDLTFKFMCQMPGQSFRVHIDKMQHRHPKDIWKIIRFQVALADWQPGQFWQYGNSFYKQWKRGEVTIFDWVNIPHSTANTSRYPRPFLQMTGLITEKTEQLLLNANRDTIFKL